jgi:hypothetical protein
MTKIYELEEYINETEGSLKDAIDQAKGWSDALSGGWAAMETLLKNLETALELIKLPPEIISALRDEAAAEDAMEGGFDATSY